MSEPDENGVEEVLPYCVHIVQHRCKYPLGPIWWSNTYLIIFLDIFQFKASEIIFRFFHSSAEQCSYGQLPKACVACLWQCIRVKRSQGLLRLFRRWHKKEEARPGVVSSIVFKGYTEWIKAVPRSTFRF